MPSAGNTIRASDVNLVRDPPACRVYNSANISIPHSATTAVTHDSERFDTDTMHSTSSNTSRITFTTAGLYLVGFHGRFEAGTDYSRAYADITLNGATLLARYDRRATTVDVRDPAMEVVTAYKFAAADYVEARVFHQNTAAAARNLVVSANESPEFWAVRVGSGD